MRFVLIVLLFYYATVFGQSSLLKEFDFAKADSVAFIHKGKSLKNLPVLTHELTSDLPTDIEKFRAIFTWVCTNIKNDYQSYLRTRNKRKKIKKDRAGFLEWNQSFTPKVFQKLISEKRTACTGYAYLIKEMANLAGFESEIVNGYGRTPTLLLEENDPPNHSWNTVKLNGHWYLCDATWSAGRVMLDNKGYRFEQNYDDAYFLSEPVLFAMNHYPLEAKMSLLEDLPSLEKFMETPVIYKEAFTQGIVPTKPILMHLYTVRDETVTFALNTPPEVDTDLLGIMINDGGRDVAVQPNIKSTKSGMVLLEYAFSRTGLYDTHIKYGDEFIATYVVRVRRN